ncbi:heme ABC exporter ATP-binding protein CcmA [Sphingomonas changnyeongensis]|uniref:heme ABC exporter ATP-binding protein CcmA n=1 Tax=Sphingomonas changnyeongensis TaxID=2698679 RepID=UPI001E50EA18|nr:heme ABC exporter ATP-binding protein CcmA [Sphingomonas changnyeongensis]
MTALTLDRLACRRGGRLLFTGLSLDLRAGQAIRITGANGTGKSSLLRVAAGLLAPFGGTVVREGRTALADEGLALDRDLPLADALGFWARLDGRASRLAPALAALGLEALAPVPVRMLSTGQRKRAVLARAVLSAAPIWLLDEPTNGLDADAIALLERACASHLEAGGLIVAATHQPLALPGAATLDLTPFADAARARTMAEDDDD